MPRSLTFTPAAVNSLWTASCWTGPAPIPYGGGRCGAAYPGGGRGRGGRRRVEAAGHPDDGAGPLPVRVGLGGQVEPQFPAGAGLGEPDGAQPVRVARAEQLAGDDGPAQMEVGVVLPGEAGAAEDLDAVLGAAVRGVERGAGGERGDQSADVVGGLVSPRARAASHTSAPACSTRTSMSAQKVLDALELADGPPELFAHLGVVGRGAQRPPGGAAGVGGEQHRRQVADEGAVHGEHRSAGTARAGRGDPRGEVWSGRRSRGRAR